MKKKAQIIGKRLAMILLGSVIVMVVLLQTMVLLLQTDMVRKRLVRAVNRQIPGSIAWSRHSFSLLSGKLEMEDLVLRDPAGNPVVLIPYLSLEPAWPTLPALGLVIENLRIEQPQVFLKEEAGGTLNIIMCITRERERLGSGSGTSDNGFPINLQIRRAVFVNGRLQYQSGPEKQILLPNVQVNLQQGDLGKQQAEAVLQLSGGEIQWDGFRMALASGTGLAKLKGGDLTRVELSLAACSHSELFITGSIDSVFDSFLPDLRMDLLGEMDALFAHFSMETPFCGSMAAALVWQGRLEKPQGQFALYGEDGVIAGFPFYSAELSCRIRQGRLDIEKGRLQAPLGMIQVTGHMDVAQALPQGLLSNSFYPSKVVYALRGTCRAKTGPDNRQHAQRLFGQLDAGFTVQGKGLTPGEETIRLSTQGRITAIQEEAVELRDVGFDVDAAGTFHQFILQKAALQTEESVLRGTGRLNLADRQVEAKLTGRIRWPDRAIRIPKLADAAGLVTVKAGITGFMDDWKLTGTIQATDMIYQDICIGRMDAEAQVSDGVVQVDPLLMEKGESRMLLRGRFLDLFSADSTQVPGMDVQVAGADISIQDFFPGTEGVVSVKGNLKGGPADPQGSVWVAFEKCSAFGQHLENLRLHFHGDTKRFYLDPSICTFSNQDKLKLQGWLSLDESRFFVKMDTNGLSLRQIDPYSHYDWGKAALFFSIIGRGRLDNPQVNGNLGIRSFRLNQEEWEPLTASLRFSDGLLLLRDDDKKYLQVKADLQTGDLEARLRTGRIQLGSWLSRVGFKDLDGEMWADIQALGSWKAWETIGLRAELANLRITRDRQAFAIASNVIAHMAGGRIELSETNVHFNPDGHLKVSGTAEINGPVKGALSGKLPAGLLSEITEQITSGEGDLLVDALISGTWEKPAVESRLVLDHVKGTVPYLAEPVQVVSGRVSFTPEKHIQGDIEGNCGRGKFHLKGGFTLADKTIADPDLLFTGHALPVAGDDYSALLDLDMQLKGTGQRSALTGEAVILEGEYFREVSLNPITAITDQRQEETTLPKTKTTASLDRMELDIRVRGRSPFVVDNNLAMLHMRPDFTIRGNAGRPVVTGRALVEEGTIFFQKNEFDVEKGVVEFINPYRIEPYFDIKGTSRIREWQISIGAAGVPDNLKVSLRSNPPLADSDILSLVILGKTNAEIIRKEDGQSSSPADYLAAYMAERIGETVKKETLLDSVNVRYQRDGSTGGETSTGFELGKDLSREVTVKYGASAMGGKVVQRATTEYRFLENVMVEAYQDSEGDYGGELQYRLEFR